MSKCIPDQWPLLIKYIKEIPMKKILKLKGKDKKFWDTVKDIYFTKDRRRWIERN